MSNTMLNVIILFASIIIVGAIAFFVKIIFSYIIGKMKTKKVQNEELTTQEEVDAWLGITSEKQDQPEIRRANLEKKEEIKNIELSTKFSFTDIMMSNADILVPVTIGGVGFFLGYLATIISKIDFFFAISSFPIFLLILYLILGIKIIEERNFLVVERFGKFWKIHHSGIILLCLPGMIDKIKNKGVLDKFRMRLYEDTAKHKFEFACGTAAPVEIHVWVSVGSMENIVSRNWRMVNPFILRYVYDYRDAERRALEYFDGIVRPILQSKSVDEAQKDTGGLVKKINSEIREDPKIGGVLSKAGLSLDGSGLIISEIEIPDEINKVRAKILLAEKEGEAKIIEERKFAEARSLEIGGIQKAVKVLKDLGFSEEEARDIIFRKQTLQTLEKTGANIFLNTDGGLTKTLEVTSGRRK